MGLGAVVVGLRVKRGFLTRLYGSVHAAPPHRGTLTPFVPLLPI